MKKIGIFPCVAAIMALSAVSAQASEPVRPGTALLSVSKSLPAGARVAGSRTRGKNVNSFAPVSLALIGLGIAGAGVGAAAAAGAFTGKSPGN